MSDNDRAQPRPDITPFIAAVTCSPEWREDHPEYPQTVIPILVDDTAGYILARLLEAGGSTYLAITGRDGVRLLAVSWT